MVTLEKGCCHFCARAQRGFTYLWVLMAIAVIGIGLASASEVWANLARRQKLAQLDWIGMQFTHAIGSYCQSSPGGSNKFPARLDDLLEDRRFVTMRRHLRQIYPDPFTSKADWDVLLGSDNRIHGIRVHFIIDDLPIDKEFVYQPSAP